MEIGVQCPAGSDETDARNPQEFELRMPFDTCKHFLKDSFCVASASTVDLRMPQRPGAQHDRRYRTPSRRERAPQAIERGRSGQRSGQPGAAVHSVGSGVNSLGAPSLPSLGRSSSASIGSFLTLETSRAKKGLACLPRLQLNSYKDAQAFFNDFVATNEISVDGAPHVDFWNTRTEATAI